MPRGPDDWMRELFLPVSPAEPPPVPLDAIMARWRRRRRSWLLAGAGTAASIAILLIIALGGDAQEPPVHLDIQFVDVPDPTDDDTETAAWYSVPEEARNP